MKDVILRLQAWWKYLLSKWLVIAIFVFIGGALGLSLSFFLKKKYTAEITFVLEDTKMNPLGSIMGLASDFGFDMGAGGGSGVFTGDNIQEFLKSRLMLERALLTPVNIRNKRLTLADLYLDIYELRDGIPGLNERSKNGLFYPSNGDRTGFSLLQDSVLNVMQRKIVKQNLIVEKPDKKLSFISAKCTSTNELFSKLFIEQLVKVATNFYIDTKTKRNKENVDRLQEQADSLEIMLNRKTYAAASTQDLNMNPARQAAGVSVELALRDKVVLQTMYAEVVKNLEICKISMAQEAPLIQIVDSPILPLEQKKMRKIIAIAIGCFLGGFFSVAFLIIKRVYRSIMSN